MRFPLFIAGRYLFSKKNRNAINIISAIAVSIFMIGTAVMIIILSFLNGLELLVRDLNNSFDPDLKVTPVHGKHFEPDSCLGLLQHINGIDVISSTLEDNVVVRYGEGQEIARLKGVDPNYTRINELDTLLVEGAVDLRRSDDFIGAVFGGTIAASLNIQTRLSTTNATVYVPMKGVEYNHLNPEASLQLEYLLPTGVIMLSEESDKDLILVNLNTARELFQTGKGVGALEIKLMETANRSEVQKTIQNVLGDRFDVRNQDEQNESAYRVFKTEKWATFAILTLVLLIAAFNTIGALIMLVLEKSKDIYILTSMGAGSRQIRRIFLAEGMLITALGIGLGCVVGLVFVWMQATYGVVKIDGSFVDSFPIHLKWTDVGVIILIISGLGLLASLYPAGKASTIQLSGNRVR